ncbi:sialidase family protein [Nonomuraea sp. NPDC005650]|uniref:sialidase family protein n=1 Tax=Nonomuraea sp. NPDC005650 TaxID=3157045 RepID=UPI0033A6A9DA
MPSPARRRRIGGLLTVLLLLIPLPALASSEAIPLTELGTGTYANVTGQPGTQAGPDTFQAGTTIVTTHQVGRFFDGGASGIAFATSSDGGATWTKGALPGITVSGGGSYQRVSDPSVAYDARHGVWLISSLALTDQGGVTGAAVLTSRSADGGLTWEAPSRSPSRAAATWTRAGSSATTAPAARTTAAATPSSTTSPRAARSRWPAPPTAA